MKTKPRKNQIKFADIVKLKAAGVDDATLKNVISIALKQALINTELFQ